jgi:hypothetical protein
MGDRRESLQSVMQFANENTVMNKSNSESLLAMSTSSQWR